MTAAVADFSGWATRNDIECADGRTILKDAFAENDGHFVPLVYQHGHGDLKDILGNVKLTNHPEGVRAEAYFNQTELGQMAKEQVKHGDLRYLSIFANQLVEKAKKVIKGNIREVSLVIAGANRGAIIDNVNIAHSDEGMSGYYDDEAIIAFISDDTELEISHADTATDTVEDNDTVKSPQEILDTLTPEQEKAVYYLLSQALTVGDSDTVKHDDTEVNDQTTNAGGVEDETKSDDDEVKTEDETKSDDEVKTEDETKPDDDEVKTEDADADKSEDKVDSDEETTTSDTDGTGDAAQHDHINQEDNSMTHNVFDQAATGKSATAQATLSHSDIKQIMHDVVENNSKLSIELKRFMKDKGVTVDGQLKHGIENIEYLFPDARTLENTPQWNSRRMEWVQKVLGAVRKAPFARIKSITADITGEEARARGYITGNMKNEEFFELSKRETTPQTIYKKQKFDRDDIIDIADFDVIAWVKMEMKLMLDEELAGAILIGDGRSSGDEDKIREANIRPIVTDAELYTTKINVNLDDSNSTIEELTDAAITARQYYKGSGTPVFYTSESVIAKYLTVKDGFGRRMYNNLSEVAQALRVSDIVPVDVLGRVPEVIGVMVNLTDYTIGTDRGGQATMFDDFDLDYNKLRYLLETRVSGALTTPKAAVVFLRVPAASVLVSPDQPGFNKSTGVVTIPSKTGVAYKPVNSDGSLGTALTAGAQTALAPGATTKIKAVPTSGYFFADDQHDDFTFTRDA